MSQIAQRGVRSHDPEIKSLMLYRLSLPGNGAHKGDGYSNKTSKRTIIYKIFKENVDVGVLCERRTQDI